MLYNLTSLFIPFIYRYTSEDIAWTRYFLLLREDLEVPFVGRAIKDSMSPLDFLFLFLFAGTIGLLETKLEDGPSAVTGFSFTLLDVV